MRLVNRTSEDYLQFVITSSLNIFSSHGRVVNPYQAPHSTVPWHKRERRSAGGSSGGSAAAVCAGICDT